MTGDTCIYKNDDELMRAILKDFHWGTIQEIMPLDEHYIIKYVCKISDHVQYQAYYKDIKSKKGFSSIGGSFLQLAQCLIACGAEKIARDNGTTLQAGDLKAAFRVLQTEW